MPEPRFFQLKPWNPPLRFSILSSQLWQPFGLAPDKRAEPGFQGASIVTAVPPGVDKRISSTPVALMNPDSSDEMVDHMVDFFDRIAPVYDTWAGGQHGRVPP